MLGHRRRNRDDRGAAAVEFALVAPILIALFFGIVDYGLLFTDTVSVRQGVREAARQGVVSKFGTTTSCNTGDSLVRLQCQTKREIGALIGTPLVKVYAPNGWVKGEPLVVCAYIPNPGVIKFVPMPNDVRSVVTTSIETQELPPTGALSVEDTLPSGSWSSWCVV